MQRSNVISIVLILFMVAAFGSSASGQCPWAVYYGTTDYNHMGYSVATMFQGIDYYVGGTPMNDDIGMDAGKVVLFMSAEWGSPILEVFGEAAGDNFGHSVACSDDVTLSSGWPFFFVGAPLNDHNGDGSGRAYVFSTEPGVTTPVQTFSGAEGWNLGW